MTATNKISCGRDICSAMETCDDMRVARWPRSASSRAPPSSDERRDREPASESLSAGDRTGPSFSEKTPVAPLEAVSLRLAAGRAAGAPPRGSPPVAGTTPAEPFGGAIGVGLCVGSGGAETRTTTTTIAPEGGPRIGTDWRVRRSSSLAGWLWDASKAIPQATRPTTTGIFTHSSVRDPKDSASNATNRPLTPMTNLGSPGLSRIECLLIRDTRSKGEIETAGGRCQG